jgi:KDO2-lipid IV(A) lauroyltransferase
VGRLPWKALGPAGAVLGWVAGSVLRIRREHVHAAMRGAGVAEPAREARAMYRSLGQSVFEFLWLASRGTDATAHVTLAPASRTAWSDAVAQGRGVVIAASHTGNWDLAACAMARETELLVVTKHLRAAGLDAFWQATRVRQGVSLVSTASIASAASMVSAASMASMASMASVAPAAPARGTFAHSLDVLSRGGTVAMMIDQVPDSTLHATALDFLGRAAFVDRAPATLAARAMAPLVVAASRRAPSGRHELYVLAVLTPPPRPGRDWIEQATRQAAQALDQFVRAYPSQWLWLHRRWKRPPPGVHFSRSPTATGPRLGM